jgi:hypothetical protein
MNWPSAYENIEARLRGHHQTDQASLPISKNHREGCQKETASGCFEQTRSRTAGPDLQSVEVSREMNLKHLHGPDEVKFFQTGIARRTLFLRCPPGFSIYL